MKRLAVATSLAWLLGACATLPEHARPMIERTHPSDPRIASANVDPIPYRTLAREDFRASVPPRHLGEHAGTMGAFTCGWIAIGENGQVPMRIEPLPDGAFVARPEGRIEVTARMDRNCSWWNTKPDAPLDVTYTLQHEQIHFAIFEVAARESTRGLATLETRGATPEAAADAFNRKLEAAFEVISKRLVERSTDLDEATSIRHDPAAQQRWWERIESELSGR